MTKAVEKATAHIQKMHHVRKVFSKCIKEIELFDQRYTAISFGDFKEDDSQIYIIHDDETDELTYKIVPVAENVDIKELIREA